MCSKNGIKDVRYQYIARQCVHMVVLSATTPFLQGRNSQSSTHNKSQLLCLFQLIIYLEPTTHNKKSFILDKYSCHKLLGFCTRLALTSNLDMGKLVSRTKF